MPAVEWLCPVCGTDQHTDKRLLCGRCLVEDGLPVWTVRAGDLHAQTFAHVTECPRCGGAHERLMFQLVARPDERVTHFAECPTTGHPVTVRVPDNPREG